ncbi:MAG: motility associated factor glycosyltransferase family protein [Gammaproteobacteria bacterium]|nr:motility associated factor glycosyltransferase family protein [Gammaproteobacteria bacterium]
MDIEQLLRQAEMQQKNLELEVQFRRNIEFLKTADPQVHAEFSTYAPADVRLTYTDEGYVNLVQITLNDKPIYPKDPQTFSQDYVDRYTEHPFSNFLGTSTTRVIDEEEDAHVSKMNRIIDMVLPLPNRCKNQSLEPVTNLMIMGGLGLGYQIPQLLQNTDIRHLIIIEPKKDMLHASLHAIDWESIYRRFKQPGHSLKFILGLSTEKSIAVMADHLRSIGLHNIIQPYTFPHFSSKEIEDATRDFFKKLPDQLTMLGYFDDEQVSLSHTIANYAKRTPVLREHAMLTKNYIDKPAFLVANGPSLDEAKEFLLSNRDKAIIFSCGTALGSLKRMGIQPDFHVEMERTRPVIEWITTSTDAAFRNDITLLALNTVHPEVLDLFPRQGIGMKASDIGTHFFSKHIDEDSYAVRLGYSNPTVANTALAFACALGFRDVYLFGTDFGFAAGEKHHSVLSQHYSVKDEHQESLDLYKYDPARNPSAPGNFGETIVTNRIYIGARNAMEKLLKLHESVHCFNTCRGLFVEGAEPTRYDEIELPELDTEKSTIVSSLFKDNFHLRGLRPLQGKKQIQRSFEPVVTVCREVARLFERPVTSVEAAHELLDAHQQLVLSKAAHKSTEYAATLLKGSMTTFNLILAKCLYSGDSLDESLEPFNKSRSIYIEFLDHAARKVRTGLLDLDTRSRDLASKLEEPRQVSSGELERSA